MTNRIFAIANCRVSTDEQRLTNSLSRQEISVNAAADKLGAEIIHTWSGSVSSKAGTNVKRKDLLAMLDTCKRNKRIKYAIFDEYDRYMRSVNEGPYFEVLFHELGVKVWYASESDTFNGDDALAKFMRSMSAFKAEGSNEERQHKSIYGQSAALKEGRYPFHPKPGYMKGVVAGLPEVHPIRGVALKEVLTLVANHSISAPEGVIELNKSDYTNDRAEIKMDKFRKIATDPFYAGITNINKQVSVRNENAAHEPLITLEQHHELLRIFDARKPNQSGPRKNGNPKYPCNEITFHDTCLNAKNGGKLVGFDHSNGKNTGKIYEKYRCRSCGMYITRDELHQKVSLQFERHSISRVSSENFLEALNHVWKLKEAEIKQNILRTQQRLSLLQNDITSRALAAIDPSNINIKSEILATIETSREKIKVLEVELDDMTEKVDTDHERFIRFAFGFIENMGSRFLELSPTNRERCKKLTFPGGFYITTDKTVYTPEISPLITFQTKKKDTEVSEKSHLVRVQGL